MFICFFVCLCIYSFVFCFNHHRIPKGSFPQNFVKIGLDLAEILRISKLDWRDRGGEEEEGEKGRRRGGILLFNGLIILEHPQEYTLKISRGSDLIWLRYSGSKKCLFVCLFVRLFVDLFIFYFNHLGRPTGIYPENFVKIGLHLCLFVCPFVSFCFNQLGTPT